jgi:DNA-binding NtrC family response regulator
LVVEDDIFLRLALSEWLRSQKHEVMEAASGDEAVALLKSVLAVDVVVTDLQMPGNVDGIALATRVRRARPGVPVIVVSGLPLSPVVAAVATAFFRKPYDMQRLAELIASIVPPPEATAEYA